MLNIKDINSIRITKIKDWNIYFYVDGDRYLLHGYDQCGEEGQILYKIITEKGKHRELEAVASNYNRYRVKDDYIKDQGGNTIVYSLINKKNFVEKLIVRNLAVCEDLEIKDRKGFVDSLREEIKDIDKQIRELEKKKYNLLDEINIKA